MHVMHIIDSMHGGGAEKSLLEIVPGLASRGVSTSIVTVRDDDGALEDEMYALGLGRIRLKHRDPLGLTFELRSLISRTRPDLVHTTLFFSNLLGRVSARSVRTPVVTTLANEDYGAAHRAHAIHGAWSISAAHAADLLTVPLTTRFHAVSADVARIMGRRLKIPNDRIQVVYRGRDPLRLGLPTLERRLRVRAALSIDDKTPVVLSVARLDRQKAVETTIDAFKHLVKWRPGAVLLVAGRPGNASSVVRAAAHNCRGIRILGHRNDVPDLMCAADVLSFPSRWEGLGGTLVEAMAMRLGIVASNIAPVAETIGDVGWPLVQPDDSEALAEGLMSALNRCSVNEARKDAGQNRFRALFTADAAAAGMASLYGNVLYGARNDPNRWRR
jgi:glycosyltransferase involved in cell wall biosynthesis